MENKPKHTPMARLAVRELKHTYELCHADMYGVPQGPALLITADKNLAYALAAAPELLEACRIAAAWIDDALLDFDLQDNGTLAEVRAAIAKAEGRK